MNNWKIRSTINAWYEVSKTMCFVAFIDVCESDRITTGMTNFRNYSDYFLGSYT